MPYGLSGKVAFVTGASSGLGVHFSHVLARHGALVAIGARRLRPLANLEAQLCAYGVRAKAIELDVRDTASVQDALSSAERHLGPVDVLINNAGITVSKPALEFNDDDFDNVIEVNLRGSFAMAKAAALSMSLRKRGTIINIASILGLRQAGQVASYAISKAGVIQMTKSLALEWARHGIRVNAIAPGYIETELNRDFWLTDAGKALIKRIPQRRLGKPEELDGPLLLLASDLSSYMTGTVIVVDGGHLVSSL